MEVLLADGVDSAQRIRRMGRAAFLRRFEQALGADVAARVWSRASQAAATATTLVARHGARFDGASFRVLPQRLDAVPQLPDYETLFGSVDSCSCAHCQSLYSPAAYLTDVLSWLGDRGGRVGVERARRLARA